MGLEEGALLQINDPQVSPEQIKGFIQIILTEKSENITHQTNEDCFFFSDIAEAIDGTDAVSNFY